MCETERRRVRVGGGGHYFFVVVCSFFSRLPASIIQRGKRGGRRAKTTRMVVAVAAAPPPPPAPHPPSSRRRRHSSSGDRPPPRRPASSDGASAAPPAEAASAPAWFVREATPQQRHRRFFDTAAARKTRLREQQVAAENRLSKLRGVWMSGLGGGGGGSGDDAFAADEPEDGGCLDAPSCPPSMQHPYPPPAPSSTRAAATTGGGGVGELRRQRRADVETIRPAKQRPASAAAGAGAGAASSLVANAEAAAAAAASAAAASASTVPLLPGEAAGFGWDVTEEPPLPALLNGGGGGVGVCLGATQQPAEAAVSAAAAATTVGTTAGLAGEEAREAAAARPMFTTQPRPLGKLFSTEDSELTRRLLRETNRRRGEEEVRLQNCNRDKHAALRRQRLAHMRWRTRTAFELSLLRREPHALAHLDAVLLAGLEETAAGGGGGQPTCRGPVAELGRAYPELCAVRDAGRWTAALLGLLRRDALAAVERRWAGEAAAAAAAATGKSEAGESRTGRLYGRHIVHHTRPVEAVSRDEYGLAVGTILSSRIMQSNCIPTHHHHRHGNLLPPEQLRPPRPARLACDASVRLARRRPSSAVRLRKECHAPSWELTSRETLLELDSFDQRRT